MKDSVKLNEKPLAMKQKPSGRLMPESEAIEYLGLGDRPNPQGALRWLMRTRRLPYVRLAKGIYGFRQGDLETFIEKSLVASGMN